MKWVSIIDDNRLRIQIENKIEEIYVAIKNFKPDNSFGLMDGYGAVFLFLYYYYKYTKQEAVLSLLNERFSVFYTSFWKMGYGAFCGGYAGICWLIRFLNKEGVIEISDIDDALCDLDEAILHFMLQDIRNGNFDFLHGSLGMAYYYATFTNKNNSADRMQIFLEALNNTKDTDSNGSIKWLKETYANYENIGMVYNLSLAHGMASIVAFLTKLFKNANNELALELLTPTILFFKNSANPENYISTFPKWFEQNRITPSESPLFWCYGDPGIAQALYNSGVLIKDTVMTDLALTALIKTTNRLVGVQEACFCHGSSSLCHIYNRLFQKTKFNVFKGAALFWLNDTIERGKNSTKYAGYQLLENHEGSGNMSLLAGLSGIGLSLLATVDTIEPKWDECVLLS